ncbi:MAG TPA: GTPase Era [Clostridiaceae bacterium]|nr:GTPase Era [Clostridiaceae bacterium]
MTFKSGFVAVIGRPNVGKSTLINRLTGEKVSIISDKPQTTRNAIRAIITEEDCQIVFIDTPGIHKPKNKLGEYMVTVATDTMNEVDAIIYIVEATDVKPGPGDMHIIQQLKEVRTPIILLINKIDLVEKEKLLYLISEYKDKLDFESIIPISAATGEGTDLIMNELKKILPEGPKYFPEDMLTDQTERILVAELIREKILHFLSEEVPHGVGVEVVSFTEREEKNLIDIQANIYCEKESHKGILIGKQGKMLKKIGMTARQEIENILGSKVFLQLWVKVKPDWRNSNQMLKILGYN